jgi:hypothetical protein
LGTSTFSTSVLSGDAPFAACVFTRSRKTLTFAATPGGVGYEGRDEEIMSMDRLRRVLTGGTLVIVCGTVIAASGCRSTRNEVPLGKPYSTTGGAPPTIGFNSDPHPNAAIGAGMYPNTTPGQPGMTAPGAPPSMGGPDATYSSGGSSANQFGTPPPSAGQLGVPPGIGRNAASMGAGIPGSDPGR